MKLFAPILAATTLMQECEADCASDGGSVFTVNCRDDLVVELTVTKSCFTENYPDMSLTDLQIVPSATSTTSSDDAPAGQCLPCDKASAQTTNSATTATYCDPASSFFAFDYTLEPATTTPVPVDDDAETLYFKVGNCGMTLDEVDSNNKAIFKTTIGKPPVVSTVDDKTFITSSTFSEIAITCSYPATIPDLPMNDLEVVADGASDDNKVKGDETEESIAADDVFTMTTKKGSPTGDPITGSVTLGESVYIGVEANAELDFYLSDCTASNGVDPVYELSQDSQGEPINVQTNTDLVKEIDLVKGGCMVAISDSALSDAISPVMDGKSLTFNQFAFADTTGGSISLGFKMTCSIVLGPAPTNAICGDRKDGVDAVAANPDADPPVEAVAEIVADPTLNGLAGRRRRSGKKQARRGKKQHRTSEYQESTEYTVTAGNRLAEAHGDIVVATDGESKTNTNSGAAVSTAAAFMAGTAIMLH